MASLDANTPFRVFRAQCRTTFKDASQPASGRHAAIYFIASRASPKSGGMSAADAISRQLKSLTSDDARASPETPFIAFISQYYEDIASL